MIKLNTLMYREQLNKNKNRINIITIIERLDAPSRQILKVARSKNLNKNTKTCT